MNLIIMGPQGSGKGTQADLLSERMGFYHIESGKLLRELAQRDSGVYELIYKKGELYPDENTLNLIAQDLKANNSLKKRKVFDGFPRTKSQYSILKRWLSKINQRIDLVVYINISEEETVKRLSARRTCVKCGTVYNLITNPPSNPGRCKCGGRLVQRADDKKETIKKRLSLFKRETKPLISEIEKDGILIEIDGERPIEEIFLDIKNAIEKVKNE